MRTPRPPVQPEPVALLILSVLSVLSVVASVLRRGLGQLARAGTERRLPREGPAREFSLDPKDAEQQPDLEVALRRPLHPHRHERPGLHHQQRRRGRHRAGTGHVPRRRHRQDALGAPLQRLPTPTSSAFASAGPTWSAIRRPATSTPTAPRACSSASTRTARSLAALADRGVRPDQRLRRPGDQPDRRRRPGHHRHAQRQLGRPGPRRQPLRRLRQEDRQGRLVVEHRPDSPATPTTPTRSSPSSAASAC